MVRNNHHKNRVFQLSQLTAHVPLVNCMGLQLRFLSPADIDQVKMLCRDWFPIEYPDTWYQEITSNPRFFSLAATLSGSIIGLIVAEIKELSQLAKEDRSLLANCFFSNTKVISSSSSVISNTVIILRLVTSCHWEWVRASENRASQVFCLINWSHTSTIITATKSRLCISMFSPQILQQYLSTNTGQRWNNSIK